MLHLVHHFLENSADLNPAQEAVVHGKRRHTYTEIEAMSNKIANYLLEFGIQSGDRVALLLRNSIAYICAYYGILKTGSIAVPLNTGIEPEEIIKILVDSSPGILISEEYFSESIREVLTIKSNTITQLIMKDQYHNLDEHSECKKNTFADIFENCSDDRPEININNNDLASIIYTSGSTGKPKGVALTHLNIVANTQSIVSYLGLTHQDRCMVVLPFYYVYGKSLLNTHFMVSGTIIIDNRFTFPNTVLKTMVEEKVTGFSGVPSTFSILINKSSIARKTFPHLRYLTQAGGHMSATTKNNLINLFPDKNIYIMYGATEASARLSFLKPRYLKEKINSIGKAIPGVEMKIVTESGCEANYGEEGEIIAKGPNIMSGYWNNSVETGKVIKQGWYYTGDLGFKDESGFFYVTGRKKDMIKVGTHKISALEVEEVLYQYDGVLEAAVIGIPDELLGESLKAFIVMNHTSNCTQTENIVKFCETILPPYKIPKEVVFRDSLPKNGSGKILKRKLT